MQARRVFVVMSVFMSIVIANADVPIIEICYGVSGDQTNPDIDGDIVVWEDGMDVYWLSLSDPNMIRHQVVGQDVQKNAAVSGQTMIWQDERNSQRDIYAYDLSTQMPLSLPGFPFADDIRQQNPDISQDTIICQHRPGSVYNIYYYDLVSENWDAVSVSESAQLYPAIDGTLVVWMEQTESVYQIFMRDIGTSNQAAPVSQSTTGQWYPAVSGNLVVWAEDRGTGSGMDIYGFDITQPQAGDFVICDDDGNQSRPAVSSDLIVWQDESKGASDFDVWGIERSGGQAFTIAATAADEQLPAVSGRTVVWQQTHIGWDIVGKTIPTQTEITVLSPAAGQQVLAGAPLQIQWDLTEGDAPAMVDIFFSDDNGNTWPTIVGDDIDFNNTYIWDSVSDANSVNCRIQLTSADGSTVYGTSDAFTVFRCNADLTADLTGDCFVGIDDFAELASQWLLCGHPQDAGRCFQ